MKKSFGERLRNNDYSSIYLEYINDWVTISSMADNYGRSIPDMTKIIMNARDQYEASLNGIKLTLLTRNQVKQLETLIYDKLMENPDMGMGEMGECRDEAERVVSKWIIITNIKVTE